MTVHDLHNGWGMVLHDGCERCEQHANHPFVSLDDKNLKRLYELSQGEWLFEMGELDWHACQTIRETVNNAKRLLKIDITI